MKPITIISAVAAGALLASLAASAEACACGCATPPAKPVVQDAKAQTTCPVMGGAINKESYVDVKGYRIYLCCPGCGAKIKADPDTYIAKIKAKGETPATAPKVLCGKCGQIKGTAPCCAEDAKRCGHCGLAQGSPGCCKIEKGKDVDLCPGCGAIAGSPSCCAAKKK